MKAMFLGFAAAIVIAIAVGVVLANVNPSTAERTVSASSVRL